MTRSEGRGAPSGDHYAQMRESRRMLDYARLSLGLSLVQLEASGQWRGASGAPSFHRFLVNEGLDARVVRPYMAVASKYILDLGLMPDAIVGYGISALNMFADIVTKENIKDIFGALDSMPAPDAKAFIQSIYPAPAREDGTRLPATTQKAMNYIDSLTIEDRSLLIQRIAPR